MKTSLQIQLMAVASAIAVFGAWQTGAFDTGRPNETVVSVLVQGVDVATAAAAVRAVGGEITHKLSIINAVGAGLTASQRSALERDAFQVRADRSVEVAGAPSKKSKKSKKSKISLVKGQKSTGKKSSGDAGDSDDAGNADDQGYRSDNGYTRDENDSTGDTIQRRLERTRRKWARLWGRDAYLRGSKPTFFPPLIGVDRVHDEFITGQDVTIAMLDTGVAMDPGIRKIARGRRRIRAV